MLSALTKTEFNCVKVLNGLSKDKPTIDQNEVILDYQGKPEEVEVDLCHGIITIFKIPECGYFVLGIPGLNTDKNANGAIQLQASIGDNLPLQKCKNTIVQSLGSMIKSETHNIISLEEFELSQHYVSHRNADWNLCYVKTIALYKMNLNLDELKNKVALINKIREANGQDPFGIYKLDEITASAKKTAKLVEEKAATLPTTILNYFTNKHEQFVVLDSLAIDALFEKFDCNEPEMLFAMSRSKTLNNFFNNKIEFDKLHIKDRYTICSKLQEKINSN